MLKIFLFPFQKLNCKPVNQNGIFICLCISIHKKKFTLCSKKYSEKKTELACFLFFFLNIINISFHLVCIAEYATVNISDD